MIEYGNTILFTTGIIPLLTILIISEGLMWYFRISLSGFAIVSARNFLSWKARNLL